MSSLPRKNSEFLAMYCKDIEEIIKPYGFQYEDRDEYYERGSFSANEWKEEKVIYYKPMLYGKVYLEINSGGRFSEFDIDANFKPAIHEIINIEKKVYENKGLNKFFNIPQWNEGGKV